MPFGQLCVFFGEMIRPTLVDGILLETIIRGLRIDRNEMRVCRKIGEQVLCKVIIYFLLGALWDVNCVSMGIFSLTCYCKRGHANPPSRQC